MDDGGRRTSAALSSTACATVHFQTSDRAP